MKHVNVFRNEIVGSLEFQIELNNDLKVDGSKEALDKPPILDEVLKQNKTQKTNVYEHFSTMVENSTSMYNNLQKPTFYSKIWMSKLHIS
jgi:hypothetical protein